MPGVEFGLQPIALGQQRRVLRREVVGQRVEAAPEGLAVEAAAGQHLVFDETMEDRGHLQAAGGDAVGHGLSGSEMKKESTSRRLAPTRVGSTPSWSSGTPSRLIHSVV